jgi:tetratricopeptide (TPR) repeat protein
MQRVRRVVGAWAAVLLLSVGACWFFAGPARAEGTPVGKSGAGDKADEKAARDAFERGRVFYDSGQFEQASVAFEEAYRLSGRDALLYNLYLAYRDASEQDKAAQALRGYLAKVPNIENRAQLEARLAALEQNLARQREQQSAASAPPVSAVTAPVEPVVVAPVEAHGEPVSSSRSPRFYAGIALAGVGAAAMITSIATGVLTKKRQQKLEDSCDGKSCDASLKDTADSGKRLAHTTDALLFSGIALAGAGAALLVFGGLERPKPEARTPRFTAACSREGCVASSTLRF